MWANLSWYFMRPSTLREQRDQNVRGDEAGIRALCCANGASVTRATCRGFLELPDTRTGHAGMAWLSALGDALGGRQSRF